MQEFKNTSGRLFVEPQGILHLEFWGVIRTTDFRELYEKAAEIAFENHLMRWINNQQKVKAIHPEYEHWMAKEYFPKTMKRFEHLGKHYSAHVLSPSFFTEMSNRRTTSLILSEKDVNHKIIEIRHFPDTESARNWLINA
ncbi:MAG: hypothetical protein NW226_10175 [Microscillaceae bacterium]|nr:hypothetical protein [Microscillaceae bacterium]